MRRWIVGSLIIGAIVVIASLLVIFTNYTVQGVVRDAQDVPVVGATVRLRATENWATTDANGAFVLRVRGLSLHRTVTAWKQGYYTGAADLTGFGRTLTIALRPLTSQDNPHMEWLPSDADPTVELACGNCHVDMHRQWRQSGHATSAVNGLVLALYNGTDAQGAAGVGHGFKLDFPHEVGNCASCHAPGAAVDHPEGVDLNRVSGEALNGVFCQFCHAIDFAHSPYAETTTGVNSLKLLRPPTGQHLFIGPFDDVPGRDTYNPIYRQSEACAACHSGGWWGVSAYASFDEWQASPYAAEGVQCQDCHMAPDGESNRSVSPCAPHHEMMPIASLPPTIGELVCQVQACVACHLTPDTDERADPSSATALLPARAPDTLSTHGMDEAEMDALVRSSVAMSVTATQGSDGVLVEVAISNVGAGHHVPTDSPMRNLILLVTAYDSAGEPLAYLSGEVVPEWGGAGAPAAGNYAGLPGKGFAKVMEDYDGNSPVPPWRNGIRILSDNRIAARTTDQSTYLFALPSAAQAEQPVRVTATLLHRRLFKTWADEKDFKMPDTLMAEVSATALLRDDLAVATQVQQEDEALFAPSLANTVHGERLDSATFATAEQCGECHTDVTGAWQASGHAQATTSPLYRARYKVATQDTSLDNIGAFCAGCHTPVGLFSGQIRRRWSWAGLEEYPLDAAAQSGVDCVVCHSIVELTATENGGYVLDPAAASLDTAQPNAVAAHPSAMHSELYSQPEFCATCHETVNPTSRLAVMTTYSEWQASRFNTGDEATETTCQDCHFAEGRHGTVRPEDLKGVAQIEVLTPRQESATELLVDVRVNNTGAGHDLPTGSTEIRQVWLAVTVSYGDGRLIYTSGEVDEYGDPVEGSVTYGTVWLDAEGKPTERLWEAASVLRDHRIPAGGSVTETFAVTLPPGTKGPLHIEAILKSRAVSGYLSGLMSTYIVDPVPSAPTIEMARGELVMD